MATILSDEILSSLICSICKQYLSFGPTKIHANKVISCGRCNSRETTNPNSLYEKVARFTFFPCINRYEGCNKLLQYKDIPQHEKSCKGTKIVCPLCPSQHAKEVSLLYLIDHYKKFHETFFLTEPKFNIDLDKNFDSTYLYCDHSENCVFLITIRCTQDMLFLNASVSGGKKIVQRFRLKNNLLLGSNSDRLCTSFPETNYYQFKVNLQETMDDIDNKKDCKCKFLYEVVEKTLPMIIASNLKFEEPEKMEVRTFRKMPKLFLDGRIFPRKHKLKLSACKSQLINEYDDNFSIKVKCDQCDRYYWNIASWSEVCLDKINETDIYGYSLFGSLISDDIICYPCYFCMPESSRIKFKAITSFIFKLGFYCRHDCKTVWKIMELARHEKQCNFNYEKDSDTFVRKCFGITLYSTEDKFINGNIVLSFCFTVEVYPFGLFGSHPKTPETNTVSSRERVIYLVTDDGLRLKIFYRYISGDTCVRIEHDFDKNKYLIVFRSLDEYPWKEVMFADCSNYCPVNLFAEFEQKQTDIGIEYYVRFKTFAVICKKYLPGSIVTL